MRIKVNKFMLVFFVIAVIAISLYAKNHSGKAVSGSADEIAGTIRVSGAWALYPIMVTWAQEFEAIHPNVKIEVSAGGAGKGMTDALSEMVDIGMVSREIRKEEVEKGAFYVPVTKDAVFATINENNPVLKTLIENGVRKETLIELWINGKLLTWGDITGEMSQEKVNVYTRSDSCGAAGTWAEYLGGTQEDLKGIGVYGDPGLAEAVNKDVLGIGFNNLNYAYDMKTGLPVKGLIVLPIDANENNKIDAEEELNEKADAIESINSGAYPSPPARDLYIVTKDNFKSPTKEFVKWILTEGQKYVDESGYIKLADSKLQEALRKV